MPQTIEGVSYPKTVAELVANRELTKLFLQTFPSKEVRNRMRFMINPPAADAVFSEYIASGSRTPITLPRHITQNAQELVMEDNYDPRLWNGILDLVASNCKTFLETEIFPDFFDQRKCKNFKDHHTGVMLGLAEKKFGDSDAVALRLNNGEVSAVKALLIAMLRKDSKAIKTFAVYLSNRSDFKVTPAEIVDAIKSGKGLSAGGSFEIDNKKLSMCGFAKPKDKKVQSRVEDMVSAFLGGDKTTAKKIFQLIQKDEPKESQIKNETIETLFKTFKRFKVVAN